MIGGFVGSGKTTLLGRLLRHSIAAGQKPTVVVDELSEAGIDGVLLRESQDVAIDIRAVARRCRCCDHEGPITGELRRLLRARRGPVFVEASGLGALPRVAHAVMGAVGAGRYPGRLQSVMLVVDARRLTAEGHLPSDVASDLSVADAVLINAADAVSAGTVRTAVAQATRMNARARVFTSAYARVPAAKLLAVRRPDIFPLHGGHGGPEEDSSRGFETVTAKMLGPIVVERLGELLERYRGRLQRVKGFVRTAATWALQELQWVPGSLELRARGRAAAQARIASELVIVGRDVDWDPFADELDGCVTHPAG